MTETELRLEIQRQCHALGLLWHHCRDSRACDAVRGLPDLIIAGPYGLIFAELKSGTGETTAHQDMWAWMLNRASFPVQTWHPADLESGLIRKKLQEIAQ